MNLYFAYQFGWVDDKALAYAGVGILAMALGGVVAFCLFTTLNYVYDRFRGSDK